jgi:2-hydroxychromene-2-carboxylate isomerase
MPTPIDFYFDFSSPYGYIASTQIDALGAKHGRAVTWRPFLLGAVFKVSEARPLTQLPPIKSNYFVHDFPRSARMFGISYKMPAAFPFMAVQASRAYYWLADRDAAKATAFAKAVYHAAFGEGRDVAPAEAVADIGAGLGIDRAAMLAAVNDATVKDRLRVEVDEAIKRGVFGSPFIFVDGEGFWGADRLPHVERWLATGGW